jgi:ABC-type proline/glycine betaine transport system substrate-binding protein
MISRLTAFAAVFAVLAATSLTYAASAHQAALAKAGEPVRVVQLERVVISARDTLDAVR